LADFRVEIRLSRDLIQDPLDRCCKHRPESWLTLFVPIRRFVKFRTRDTAEYNWKGHCRNRARASDLT
jgi:hypothetical protein